MELSDNTRVVFDTTGEVEHMVFTLAQPDRVVVDIQNSSLKLDWSTLDLAGSPIRKIRHANKKGGDLRLVFDLSEPSSVKSFVLEPNNKYGHRLVIDLTNNSKSRKKTAGRPWLASLGIGISSSQSMLGTVGKILVRLDPLA